MKYIIYILICSQIIKVLNKNKDELTTITIIRKGIRIRKDSTKNLKDTFGLIQFYILL